MTYGPISVKLKVPPADKLLAHNATPLPYFTVRRCPSSTFVVQFMLRTYAILLLILLVAWVLLPFAAFDRVVVAATPTDPPSGSTAIAKVADDSDAIDQPSLDELKQTGWMRSRFKDDEANDQQPAYELAPQANLPEFEGTIKSLISEHCIDCHGSEVAEGNLRIDTLNPDLLRGGDTDWWQEVFAVVSKEEMPPPDSSTMSEGDRRKLVDWLSEELQAASILRRNSGTQSSFRRLTRYEYNYALQDLLGLPWDFAKDLPPEPHTHEGFENSSALLHLTVTQMETYNRLVRQALQRATVIGERPPTLVWGIAMKEAAAREWPSQDEEVAKLKSSLANEPDKLAAELKRLEDSFFQPHGAAYYKQISTGRTAPAKWDYGEAKYAFAPQAAAAVFPEEYDCVAILPSGSNQRLIVELGNQLPDDGLMRVTVRAARVDANQPGVPSLQLLFGWQASNEGRALLRVSRQDVPVTAGPDAPQIIQWDVPLGEIYPRNSVRKTSAMGETPSPSEYIRLANSSAAANDIQIDHVTVEAPFFEQWPPASHRRIFIESEASGDEMAYAAEILQSFMSRAWRRPITAEELDQKLQLFSAMRSESESFEEAIVEVLTAVLSAPQFLFVANSSATGDLKDASDQEVVTSRSRLDHQQLVSRLALFLWCSLPDEELLNLASNGEIANEGVLQQQVERMLSNPRSGRFATHFVQQWLNLELLSFVNFDRHLPNFDPLLKESMSQEPIALFEEVLRQNASVLDFVHADYAVVNERLAQHYGLTNVYGNEFRRVALDGDFKRGGLLTQAGFLAMNSDWPDSHPLKRAIWLLERLLNDPPPPPPPAVPQIDLADPEIAKMTLKERIEDHRNQAACRSCHVKIDPWGLAFENYDALGLWRDEVRGKAVDASSELFNQQKLDGMYGLKHYLLDSRQDQFVQAMVHKLTTFALGRPLGFEDRAEIEAITKKVRQQGDGLRTMVNAIVASDLFRNE